MTMAGDNQHWRVNSTHTRDEFIEYVGKLYDEHKYIEFRWTAGKQRSTSQNNAMHLWLSRLAEALNNAGLDMRKVLKPEVEIPWTMLSAKEHLWKPILKTMYGKDSTTQPNTIQHAEVYKVLDRHLSEKFNIHIEYPTKGEK